ncbi:hypothetical protein F4774DRAFT_186221 [Daldinia eschscholtzii]|nr:hypothetical protein F4774DRAFT_186221 [Daldinia eschscholtzii]
MGNHGDARPHGDGSEPITERTALLGDDYNREGGQRPIAIPRWSNENDDSEDDDDDGSGSDLDPNESDLLVARSFTSGASGLAPESFESAMLRGRRRSRSSMRRRYRRASTVHSYTSLSPRPMLAGQHQHQHQHQLADDDSLSNVISDGESDLEAAAAAADVEHVAGKQGPAYLIDTDRKRFGIVFMSIMLTHFIACFDGTIVFGTIP